MFLNGINNIPFPPLLFVQRVQRSVFTQENVSIRSQMKLTKEHTPHYLPFVILSPKSPEICSCKKIIIKECQYTFSNEINKRTHTPPLTFRPFRLQRVQRPVFSKKRIKECQNMFSNVNKRNNTLRYLPFDFRSFCLQRVQKNVTTKIKKNEC